MEVSKEVYESVRRHLDKPVTITTEDGVSCELIVRGDGCSFELGGWGRGHTYKLFTSYIPEPEIKKEEVEGVQLELFPEPDEHDFDNLEYIPPERDNYIDKTKLSQEQLKFMEGLLHWDSPIPKLANTDKRYIRLGYYGWYSNTFCKACEVEISFNDIFKLKGE